MLRALAGLVLIALALYGPLLIVTYAIQVRAWGLMAVNSVTAAVLAYAFCVFAVDLYVEVRYFLAVRRLDQDEHESAGV